MCIQYSEVMRLLESWNFESQTNAYIQRGAEDVELDIFERGLCFPSDNKMSMEEQ